MTSLHTLKARPFSSCRRASFFKVRQALPRPCPALPRLPMQCQRERLSHKKAPPNPSPRTPLRDTSRIRSTGGLVQARYTYTPHPSSCRMPSHRHLIESQHPTRHDEACMQRLQRAQRGKVCAQGRRGEVKNTRIRPASTARHGQSTPRRRPADSCSSCRARTVTRT